jgi:cobyric acid synthase
VKNLLSQLNPAYKGYNFKQFKKDAIESFAQHIQNHIDMPSIMQQLQTKDSPLS